MERIYIEISHVKGATRFHVRGMWTASDFPGTQLRTREEAECPQALDLGQQELYELTMAVKNEIESWVFVQAPLF
jgi:hypothetical protein